MLGAREVCGCLKCNCRVVENNRYSIFGDYRLCGALALPFGGWFRLVRSPNGPEEGGRGGGGGGGGFCPGAPKYFVIASSSF